MKDLKTTNMLLLFVVVPVIFFLLKLLSFIFIPLVMSMFITVLFLPIMRWFKKKNVPKAIGIFVVVLIIAAIFKMIGELIHLSSREFLETDSIFFEKAQSKLLALVVSIESFFGINRVDGKNVLVHYFQNSSLMTSFGSTIDFISHTLSMTLMTAFFVILWLAGSIDFQKLLSNTIFKRNYTSVKTFIQIEKNIILFVIVKFGVSFFTGLGFGLACYFFDVSFPIFWGLLAFSLNFIQMIGSVISVILLSLFAFVELDPTSTLLFFIISIIAVQAIIGGVLEPIFLGKSFSINIITVLVMLMLWGYIWGIPGLIMSIPITVFVRIILDQFPNTKRIGNILGKG